MAHKHGNSAKPYRAPKRNAHEPGQFASGESKGGSRMKDSQGMSRTDPSSGETRSPRDRTPR